MNEKNFVPQWVIDGEKKRVEEQHRKKLHQHLLDRVALEYDLEDGGYDVEETKNKAIEIIKNILAVDREKQAEQLTNIREEIASVIEALDRYDPSWDHDPLTPYPEYKYFNKETLKFLLVLIPDDPNILAESIENITMPLEATQDKIDEGI